MIFDNLKKNIKNIKMGNAECKFCSKKYETKDECETLNGTTCHEKNNRCSYNDLLSAKNKVKKEILKDKDNMDIMSLERNKMILKTIEEMINEREIERMTTAFLCIKKAELAKINKNLLRLMIDKDFRKENGGIFHSFLDKLDKK